MQLLHQKMFYPYSSIVWKLSGKILAQCTKRTNSLQDRLVSISPENFQHANVFQEFVCQILSSYHDLYLATDTLLLACVVEQFRKVTYFTYGLDTPHYYTFSHLSGDAFLKVIEAIVELPTDRSHLEMVENLIRGSVSSMFSKRLATMSNKYLEGFDETEQDYRVSSGMLTIFMVE